MFFRRSHGAIEQRRWMKIRTPFAPVVRRRRRFGVEVVNSQLVREGAKHDGPICLFMYGVVRVRWQVVYCRGHVGNLCVRRGRWLRPTGALRQQFRKNAVINIWLLHLVSK